MATAYAKINPAMLNWAQQRAQLSIAALADKLKVPEEKLYAWASGDKPLTFRQAQTFASKTHVPFGYLFLQHPPEDKLPLPDLRTVGGKQPQKPSAELLDIVKIVLQRQSWYQEYMADQLVPPPEFIGRFTVQTPCQQIVDDMRQKLGVGEYPERGTWEDYYRDLVDRIEAAGVMVMRESFLNHWTRPFNADEFRGFAIADEQAPLIFINHADWPSARLFTLIHELCHIWLGVTGISDGDPFNKRQEEILCNQVAAEFLVPSEEFEQLWREDLNVWTENIAELRAHFHVSSWVIARRALTLEKIDLQTYRDFIQAQEEAWRKQSKSDGGPTYYVSKKSQLSSRFARAVAREALSGKILLRDAGRLLNIKPDKIKTFAKELGV
jgi:Zn-dependent peptidase ImmA (M78 family)